MDDVVLPKYLLLFDIGVLNAILGIHRRPITLEQKGSVFEQWLTLQIIYTGSRRQLLENGVHVLPYTEALEELEGS